MPLTLKSADLVGFAAIFAAGWYVGQHSASGGWQWYDLIVIFGLLAIGFYFSVVLS